MSKFVALLAGLLLGLAAWPTEAATYYVRKTGNNSNTGTTAAQAWLTIDKAANTVVAGDVVYVGAGTYNEEVTPTNDGTAGNYIRYVADTTGAFTGDAGTVLISSITFQAFDIDTDNYLRLTGFKMTGGFSRTLRINSSTGVIIEDCEIYSGPADGMYVNGSSCTIDRCIVRNCSDYGLQLAGTSTVTVTDCDFRSNNIGIFSDGLGTRVLDMTRCEVKQNTGRGCYLDSGAYTLKNCLIRANGSDGLWLLNGTATLWHCTLNTNQAAGIRQSAGTANIRNCIVANSSQYGLLASGGIMTHTYNCVYNNPWGNFSGTFQSTGENTSDPRFWSTTCFELQDGSPCINTGVNPGGAVTDDIEKVARPSGGAYDMGCYETIVVNYTSLVNAYTTLNPYAWWRLNETSSSTASDQMGVRNGTYQNGVVLNQMGVPVGGYNKAADFDGVNDKVNLSTINPTVTAMSFVGWMKADSFSVTNSDILAKATGTADANYYWSIGNVNSGGYQRLQFRFRASGATGVAVATSDNLGTGAWVFVAGVYNGQTLIVYKDGAEVGRTTLAGTPDLSAATNAAIGDNPIGGRPFDGQLDEIAIFTKELKPRDIAAIYASALKGSITATVPKLWGIDEDDSTLFSFTNYSNTATLTTYGRLKWKNGAVNTDFGDSANISSMAITRHGRAYLTTDTSFGTFTAPVLLSFDLVNASTTLPNVVAVVGNIPTLTEIRGLAIDPTNEDLYALRSDGWLFVISATNASIIRTVGQVTGMGEVLTTAEDMAFDAYGNLFVMDDADDEFYRVNKINGAILEVANNGGSIGTIQAFAWDNVNSRVLVSETTSGFFINAAANMTSASYVVGLPALGLTDVEAMSFVPSEGRTGIWPVGVRVLKWKEMQ